MLANLFLSLCKAQELQRKGYHLARRIRRQTLDVEFLQKDNWKINSSSTNNLDFFESPKRSYNGTEVFAKLSLFYVTNAT